MDFSITVASIIVSVGVSWGIMSQKMKQMETRVSQLETDNRSNRELLVEINSKLQMLLDGVIHLRKRD